MLCARAGSSFFFLADWGAEPFGMANSGPGAGIGAAAVDVVGAGGGGATTAYVVGAGGGGATTADVVTVAVGTENIESYISFT